MTLGFRGGAIALVFWFCHGAALPASAQCPDPSARIIHIDRQVDHKPVSSAAFVSASLNLDICRGDAIRTGERSRATLMFVDGTRLVVDQNTEWVMSVPAEPGRTLVELIRGAILFFTRQPRALGVRTPFVNAAVEGTEFLVRVESDRTVISVFEGTVVATSENDVHGASGSLTLVSGESAVAVQGRAPERQVIVRPRDGVQWALYYQPILPADSFEELEKVPEAERDARFYVRRAGLLLGVGRLDEARADLEQALARDPNNSDAYALQAIIAVALNEPTDALASGREAVKRNPGSVEARLALSYALQANFQLEAARDELLTAVADHPDDPRAWSRLAELWLSLGYLDRSLEAAERAVALAPDDARAKTVAGFASLARVDIAEARTAFEQAIMLDSGSPLARLGLGLAKIRAGDLAEGRGEIEIAAALNPDDPIVRSYLGKAYFEEKREPLPGPQFDRAKEIDPYDPTPWFYDAIRKQTINRPVEALRDLDTSIELNDNRAVYRSRLMLDEDLAARSASLGRLYRELGFEQRALVEAWRSIEADPADYSGHRFLSDIYSVLPRHEVARVSELLQSQLLQPLSMTPVPPRLAETDVFILEHAGPDEPAFNEFNPLFNRNRIAIQVSGAGGNLGLLGDEATVSGIWNRLSFSVGQFHYETDGFRENNAQDRDIYNAFVQVQLSPSTSVQAELRSEDTVTGDLNLLFDPENFSPDQRVDVESTVLRFGLRQVFSPRSQLIASFYVNARDSTLTSSADEPALGITGDLSFLSDTDSWTFEVRHLLQVGHVRLSSGFGYFRSDRNRTETLNLQLPFPPFTQTETTQFSDDPEQTNAYVYALIDWSNRATFTLGGSADFFQSLRFDRNQFNPKAGVSWNVQPSTTIRAAVFRTLHRAVVSSQTIEPTLVSGFNQFFADDEGEETLRYGLGVDQKFGDRAFGGAEYSWRNLWVPVTLDTVVERFERDEQLARSYFYWVPRNGLALSVEYLFERFDRDAGSSGDQNILELRTHRLPLGMAYFSPRGWYARSQAAYVSQRGSFAAIGSLPAGEDRFWVVDVLLGYRLPRRYGRIAFEVKNLFDEEFNFQDTDPGNPVVRPRRLAVLRFSLGI